MKFNGTIRQIICLGIMVLMIFSSVIPGVIFNDKANIARADFKLWDGYRETNSGKDISLLDFNSIGAIMDTGATISTNYAADGNRYSAYWANQKVNKEFYIKEFPGWVPSDWTEYSEVKMNIYSVKATGAAITVTIYSPNAPDGISYFMSKFNVDWTGWKTITINIDEMSVARSATKENVIQFCLVADGGWSMVAHPETELYISSVSLGGNAVDYDFAGSFYGDEKINKAFESLADSAAVYADSKKVAKSDGVSEISGKPYLSGREVMIPVSVLGDCLGAKVTDSASAYSVSIGENTINGTVGFDEADVNGETIRLSARTESKDGLTYVPGEQITELLGLNAFTDGSLLIMGSENAVNAFRRPENVGVNEYNEIISYMLYSEIPSSDEYTKEDRSALIKNWKKHIAGDSETNDLSDVNVAQKIKSINQAAKSAWDILRKDPASNTLFEGNDFSSSASLTSAYTNVARMATAYAAYGSDYYQNEKLFDDIIYALNWLKTNCFSTQGRASWSITGFNNWWDWGIGSPEQLVNTLICIEDKLSASQLRGYLEYFDKTVPQPNGYGANFVATAKIVVGSAVLQGDHDKAVKLLSKLQKEYLYVDDNKRMVDSTIYPREFPVKEKGAGFFTDGSYVYHTLHPMNSLYGLAQFRTLVEMDKLVAGTKYDIQSPFKKHLVEIYFNSFDSVVFETISYRSVKGRGLTADISSGGIEHLLYGFRLSQHLDDADVKREIESIVKAAYLKAGDMVKTTFINSMAIDEIAAFNKILADDSIKPRENRRQSKVFYNMDKTVHARDEWGFSLSMSSTRIFNYESINNENIDGWYTSDGRTEYYLSGSNMNTTAQYWSSMNKYRLPGTTVDTQERIAASVNGGNEYLSTKEFVGGVELDGEYSASAMELESYHNDEDFGLVSIYGGVNPAHKSDLTAKKAYFMLDDGFLCLGSAVNAKNNNDAEVLTIVDNPLSNQTVSLSDGTILPYEIVSAVANRNPQTDNMDIYSIDGNVGTKWAGDEGSEIVWDLGEVKTLGFAEVSLLYGGKRKQYLKLDVSVDGESWERIFDGETSGTRESNEPIDLKGCKGRYVKYINEGNSDGSPWVSISECKIYPPKSDGTIGTGDVEIYGSDPITVDGNVIELLGEDKVISGASWANFNNQVGYWFPKDASVNGGELKCRWTKDARSHFELWFSHGVNPTDGGYAYAVLPGKTTEETKAFSENGAVTIIRNDKSIQAAKDNRTGITYIVFWEKGEICGIKAEQPCMVIMRETDSGIELGVSDPTQKLTSGKLIINRPLKAVKADEYAEVTSDSLSTYISFDFSNSVGRTYSFDLTK